MARGDCNCLWAVVDANANLVRGKEVAGAQRAPGSPAGMYWVEFNEDVSAWAWLATILQLGDDTQTSTHIRVSEAYGARNPNVVQVGTWVTGNFVDSPFHLGVFR
jgi:hypothetical protein